MHPYTRRTFTLSASAALAGSAMQAVELGAKPYQRPDASWFAACPFGISTHWTALSQTIHPADWRPFPETVAKFDVERFADLIASSGASYLIFTSCHALQWLAGPCDAIERILPSRTNKRDMIGELARALRRRGIHLILYYNHSCNHGDDPAWELAVGYHEPDKSRFVANLLAIIRELGERQGDLIKAWWFDSCYSVDTHGRATANRPSRTTSAPLERVGRTAKAGYADRLVTLNAGMMRYYLYTDHQDYEWGEANDLVAVPAAQFTPDGLQAHRWVCLDNFAWVHSPVQRAAGPRPLSLEHCRSTSKRRTATGAGHLQHRRGPQRRLPAGDAGAAEAASDPGGLRRTQVIFGVGEYVARATSTGRGVTLGLV